jgi:hypothetical protein
MEKDKKIMIDKNLNVSEFFDALQDWVVNTEFKDFCLAIYDDVEDLGILTQHYAGMKNNVMYWYKNLEEKRRVRLVTILVATMGALRDRPKGDKDEENNKEGNKGE